MRVRHGKYALIIAGMVLAMFSLMQLKPIDRTNPPVAGEIAAPAPIEATLRRSCYDCHSNETHWRWYSAVAPISWMVAHHVQMGRKEIDFSDWNSYYPATQRRKLKWIERVLQDQVMPPWSYRIVHPESRLTDQDRAALERWISTELAH